jgi:hypothetical protein
MISTDYTKSYDRLVGSTFLIRICPECFGSWLGVAERHSKGCRKPEPIIYVAQIQGRR